jgi:hypothetical protein
MVEPIRDHWLIVVAVTLVVALAVWLVATRRRGGNT